MFIFKNKKFLQKTPKPLFYYSHNLFLFLFLLNIISIQSISNNQNSEQICLSTTYDNTSVTEECHSGPKKRTRILEYSTFNNYISDHSFKHNGLPFYSSLYVDTDYHNLGDFMNGGMVISFLFLITIILIAAWIPIICCWKHEVCIFDECFIPNNCCFILWNFIIYLFLAAILSFIIVAIIFAE